MTHDQLAVFVRYNRNYLKRILLGEWKDLPVESFYIKRGYKYKQYNKDEVIKYFERKYN